MLDVVNLEVEVDSKLLLKQLSLKVQPGEVHVIMGPNGAGKSTLAKVLAGHPSYTVTGGEIVFEGKQIQEMEPEERAKLGIFLSFQSPVEIPGLTNLQLLHAAYKACRGPISLEAFEERLDDHMKLLKLRPDFKCRGFNDGFSGGEKKKNELLHASILEPKCMILDEIDSGLDIDAIKEVALGVTALRTSSRAFVIVTHYQRLLDYIAPDYVHVMAGGRIVETGGAELALHLEKEGYHVYS